MNYSTIEGCIRQTLCIPLMKKLKMITYSKIPFTRDTKSSHVGKWRIHYQNGDQITSEDLNVDPANWPDYPTVVETEEEALIFSQSWDDWILSAKAALTL